MFVVFEIDGAYCIDHVGDLIMPSRIEDLQNLKSALELIFSLKRYHVALAKKILPVLEKKEKLQNCCPSFVHYIIVFNLDIRTNSYIMTQLFITPSTIKWIKLESVH